MAIEKPLNKRAPEIADEVLPDYAKLSKADLIEICFSFARMNYGEALSDKALMAKVKREHEALKRSQGR